MISELYHEQLRGRNTECGPTTWLLARILCSHVYLLLLFHGRHLLRILCLWLLFIVRLLVRRRLVLLLYLLVRGRRCRWLVSLLVWLVALFIRLIGLLVRLVCRLLWLLICLLVRHPPVTHHPGPENCRQNKPGKQA